MQEQDNDEIFGQRSRLESAIKQLDIDIENEKSKEEELVNDLAPEQKDLYRQKQNENKEMHITIDGQQVCALQYTSGETGGPKRRKCQDNAVSPRFRCFHETTSMKGAFGGAWSCAICLSIGFQYPWISLPVLRMGFHYLWISLPVSTMGFCFTGPDR